MPTYFTICLNETFLWYCFSDENINSIEKLFLRYEVRGNDGVTKRSLPQYFGPSLWMTAAC